MAKEEEVSMLISSCRFATRLRVNVGLPSMPVTAESCFQNCSTWYSNASALVSNG